LLCIFRKTWQKWQASKFNFSWVWQRCKSSTETGGLKVRGHMQIFILWVNISSVSV